MELRAKLPFRHTELVLFWHLKTGANSMYLLVHRHVHEARQQLSVLHWKETREVFVCAWLSTVLAKSEQQHGATGGIQTVPALNFTCQRMGTSLGKQTEGELSPKAQSISQQSWRARPILWPRVLPYRHVPRGTARFAAQSRESC